MPTYFPPFCFCHLTSSHPTSVLTASSPTQPQHRYINTLQDLQCIIELVKKYSRWPAYSEDALVKKASIGIVNSGQFLIFHLLLFSTPSPPLCLSVFSCLCSSCVNARKEARFLSIPFYISQSSNENAFNRWRASETVAWNVGSIAAITAILVPRSTSGGTTGTPDRKDTLAEAQRDTRCLLFQQSSSVRWVSSSESAPVCYLSPCPRIYADKVHFALEILSNSRYHLQRSSLRLSARSSESQQRSEA